tara:strand:+ start:1906 stop:3960 length:2055 start_codon:yes stop_codon:yes gene_type:complete
METNFLNKDISFRDIFDAILENIFLIVGLCFFSLLLVFGYLYTAPKIYLVKSLLQFEKSDNDFLNLSAPIFAQDTINHQEQAALYKSVNNFSKAIRSLNLDIRIDGNYILEIDEKYFDDIYLSEPKEPTRFDVVLADETYSVMTSDETFENLEYNVLNNVSNLDIRLDRKETSYQNKSLQIFKNTIRDEVRYLTETVDLSSIGQTSYGRQNSILEIRTYTSKPETFITIVDELNKTFIEGSVVKNAAKARNSINFLDTRISEIETSLKIAETNLNKFKTKNLFFEQDNEGKILQEQLIEFERTLNEMKLEELEAKVRFTDSNQELINIMDKKTLIAKEIDEIRLAISQLPQIEQEFIDLSRSVEINQELLELLLSKNLEYSILEASTLADIYVVDSAYNDRFIGPRISSTTMLSLTFAFLIGFVIALIRKFFYARVISPSSIERLEVADLIGVIPLSDNVEDSQRNESFRSLVTNILFSTQHKSIISISGALKEVGKTYVATNLARAISELNKKTLIIDCDFHRGDLHENFSVEKLSIDQFLKCSEEIEKYKCTDNLYVLPRPSNQSSTALAILSSPEFKAMLDNLKKEFDYIVLDTPPCLPLSDALVIYNLVDLMAFVVRQDQTLEYEINESIKQFNTIKDKKLQVVFNAYKKPSAMYGYQKYDYYAYKYYYARDKYEYEKSI